MARGQALGAIVAKEVMQMWRDRSVLLLVFVLPLALAGITTLAFGPLAKGATAKLGVIDSDHGAQAQILVNQVLPQLRGTSGSALVKVTVYPTLAKAQAATKSGKDAATIVIPAGFSADVQAGRAAQLTLLTGKSTGIGVPVATSVLQGFTAQIGSNELSVILATSGKGAVKRTPALVTAATAQRNPVNVQAALSGTGTLSASSFFAPSMVVLALFFCGQVLARGLVAERRTRTLARILLTDTTPSTVLSAKFLVALGTGLLSAAVVLGLFAAFGVRFGNLAVLVLLVVVAAVAMISASSLAVLLSRNDEQAGTLGTVTVFVLAIIGGNFVPLSQTRGALTVLALFTPNGWAVRGFANLAVATANPLRTVAPELAAMAGFALLAGVPALLLSRRALKSAGV